jgi:hypothetical protein
MNKKETKTFIDEILVNLEVDFITIINMFDSEHRQDCCEQHELDFSSFHNDFQMVENTLSKIDKIEIYGEENM